MAAHAHSTLAQNNLDNLGDGVGPSVLEKLRCAKFLVVL